MDRVTQLALICYWLKNNDRDLAVKGMSFRRAAQLCSKDLGFKISARRLSKVAYTLINHAELKYYIGFEGGLYGKPLLTSREWNKVMDWVVERSKVEDAELTARWMKRAGIKYASPGIVEKALHATRHTRKNQNCNGAVAA